MRINTQNILENDQVILYPLQEQDFEEVYKVASDPEIWEQHPNKDRWQKEVFKNFFKGAMQSNGNVIRSQIAINRLGKKK